MQIILLEKVINVGDLGEVVKVKQGYARNFLIPQGKAKRATADLARLEGARDGGRLSGAHPPRRVMQLEAEEMAALE